eukprot:4432849-Pyramimonas_sp.AAC.1
MSGRDPRGYECTLSPGYKPGYRPTNNFNVHFSNAGWSRRIASCPLSTVLHSRVTHAVRSNQTRYISFIRMTGVCINNSFYMRWENMCGKRKVQSVQVVVVLGLCPPGRVPGDTWRPQ